MSDRFETVEVPFVTIGNMMALTFQQVKEQPWLREFIDRFPLCFSRDEVRLMWIYEPTMGEIDE